MATPSVSGVSPSQGSFGTKIVIRGENLGLNQADILSVTICDIDCTKSVKWFSQSKITCVLSSPTNASFTTGAGKIVVSTHSSNGVPGLSHVQFYLNIILINITTESPVWADEDNEMLLPDLDIPDALFEQIEEGKLVERSLRKKSRFNARKAGSYLQSDKNFGGFHDTSNFINSAGMNISDNVMHEADPLSIPTCDQPMPAHIISKFSHIIQPTKHSNSLFDTNFNPGYFLLSRHSNTSFEDFKKGLENLSKIVANTNTNKNTTTNTNNNNKSSWLIDSTGVVVEMLSVLNTLNQLANDNKNYVRDLIKVPIFTQCTDHNYTLFKTCILSEKKMSDINTIKVMIEKHSRLFAIPVLVQEFVASNSVNNLYLHKLNLLVDQIVQCRNLFHEIIELKFCLNKAECGNTVYNYFVIDPTNALIKFLLSILYQIESINIENGLIIFNALKKLDPTSDFNVIYEKWFDGKFSDILQYELNTSASVFKINSVIKSTCEIIKIFCSLIVVDVHLNQLDYTSLIDSYLDRFYKRIITNFFDIEAFKFSNFYSAEHINNNNIGGEKNRMSLIRESTVDMDSNFKASSPLKRRTSMSSPSHDNINNNNINKTNFESYLINIEPLFQLNLSYHGHANFLQTMMTYLAATSIYTFFNISELTNKSSLFRPGALNTSYTNNNLNSISSINVAASPSNVKNASNGTNHVELDDMSILSQDGFSIENAFLSTALKLNLFFRPLKNIIALLFKNSSRFEKKVHDEFGYFKFPLSAIMDVIMEYLENCFKNTKFIDFKLTDEMHTVVSGSQNKLNTTNNNNNLLEGEHFFKQQNEQRDVTILRLALVSAIVEEEIVDERKSKLMGFLSEFVGKDNDSNKNIVYVDTQDRKHYLTKLITFRSNMLNAAAKIRFKQLLLPIIVSFDDLTKDGGLLTAGRVLQAPVRNLLIKMVHFSKEVQFLIRKTSLYNELLNRLYQSLQSLFNEKLEAVFLKVGEAEFLYVLADVYILEKIFNKKFSLQICEKLNSCAEAEKISSDFVFKHKRLLDSICL